MQQADYQCHRPTPRMQESVSMHKSPTPVRHSRMNQVRETGKTDTRRLMERKSLQQYKNLSEKLKLDRLIDGALIVHAMQQRVKAGGGTHSFP